MGRDLTAWESALALAAAVTAAWLSYRFVETPLRHGTAGARGKIRALAMWPVATAGVMAAVLGLGAYAATPGQAVPATTTTASPTQLTAAVRAAAQEARAGAALPEVTTPALTDLFGDVTEPAPGCSASTVAQVTQKACFMGDTGSTHTIVAWGDSHIGMWMRPLSELAAARHYRIVFFGKASCLPIDQLLVYHGKAYSECDQFRGWVLDQIRALKPERVIISGYTSQDFFDAVEGRPVPAQIEGKVNAQASVLFREAAGRTLEKLTALAPDVSVISDVTVLEKSAADCLGSRTATRATCAAPLHPVIADRDASWRAAADEAGAHYVDLIPYLCDDRTCPVVVGSEIVYRDQTHITESYARTLKPVLAAQLRLT